MVRMASLVTRLREVSRRSELGGASCSPVNFGFADILAPYEAARRAGSSGSRHVPSGELRSSTGSRGARASSAGWAQQRSRLVKPPVGLFCIAVRRDCKARALLISDEVLRQFWLLNQKIQPTSPLCAKQA